MMAIVVFAVYLAVYEILKLSQAALRLVFQRISYPVLS